MPKNPTPHLLTTGNDKHPTPEISPSSPSSPASPPSFPTFLPGLPSGESFAPNPSEQQLHRLFSITACRTQAELAKLLGVSLYSLRNTIKKVRGGADIPATWLVTLSRIHRVPPEWILTGQGPRVIIDMNSADSLHDFAHSHYESAEFMNASPCEQKALQQLSTQLLLREIMYREYVKPTFLETRV